MFSLHTRIESNRIEWQWKCVCRSETTRLFLPHYMWRRCDDISGIAHSAFIICSCVWFSVGWCYCSVVAAAAIALCTPNDRYMYLWCLFHCSGCGILCSEWYSSECVTNERTSERLVGRAHARARTSEWDLCMCLLFHFTFFLHVFIYLVHMSPLMSNRVVRFYSLLLVGLPCNGILSVDASKRGLSLSSRCCSKPVPPQMLMLRRTAAAAAMCGTRRGRRERESIFG